MIMDASVRISKVENGWTVSKSWEEENEKSGDTDYKSKEWVFLTLEETLKKVEEIVKCI